MVMAKSNPLPCQHVFNHAHPDSYRAHAKFRHFWSQCLDMMSRHIHTNQNVKMGSWIKLLRSTLNLCVFCFFLFFFLGTFSLYTPMGIGVARRDPTHVTPKVNFVYAYHVLSLSLQGFVWPKYHFWVFGGLTWTQKWVWSYTCT